MADLLEQYFKLDHEGEAGGQRTRFRYKQVPASTFGMSVEDLLARDDKELNQVCVGGWVGGCGFVCVHVCACWSAS